MDTEVKTTYGYLGIDQNSFDNIVRKPNLTVDIPKTGYNFGSTNYVCENISRNVENIAFLNTVELLSAESKQDAQSIMIDAFMSEKTIVGEVPINPESNQFLLLDDIMFIARQTLANDEIENRRMVVPLTLDSKNKETHGVALCIDMDKNKKHANIMILVQHAHRDGGNLDFSKEVDMTLSHLDEVFKQVGISVDTFQNNKPICREKGVCGIISTEVCRRLIEADNPMKLAQIGAIKINSENVKKIHNNNFRSYQQNKSLNNFQTKNQGFNRPHR